MLPASCGNVRPGDKLSRSQTTRGRSRVMLGLKASDVLAIIVKGMTGASTYVLHLKVANHRARNQLAP